jgi:hypothetical protein
MIRQSFCGKLVELSSGCVLLELKIPSLCVELSEPTPQFRELSGGKRLNSLLDRMNITHGELL